MKKNYVVYQHVTPDGMYYFGATSNIKRRWECNGINYKRTSLQPFIEKYGWENIQHIVLFRDQTKEDALWIEDFLITTAQEDGVCINQRRSGNVSKEEGYRQQKNKQYYEQNRDKIKEQSKQYYEQNKEEYKEYQRDYREKNKEEYKEYQRDYREKNREKNCEYQREYRQRKKEEKQLKEVESTPLF